LGVGQSVSPDDTMDAFNTLNMMMGQFQVERLSVYHLVDAVKQSTGALSYTIGIGGDFNVLRPIKIESAFARLPQSGTGLYTDFPCEIIPSREDYNRIGVKQLGSLPDSVYYDAGFPLGALYFWPVPNASYELHVTTMETLQQFAAPASVVNLPPPYMAMIRYQLAVYLAPSYQIQPMSTLVGLATNAKRVVKRMNHQIAKMTMPAGVLNRMRFNIYTGGAY
jgi:hypothetical protein